MTKMGFCEDFASVLGHVSLILAKSHEIFAFPYD